MISQAPHAYPRRRAARIVLVAGLVIAATVVLTMVIVPELLVAQLERRLRMETGLTWHIRKAHLFPSLSLELSDVSANYQADYGSPPLFSAKLLNVSGPPRLFFGGAGTAQIAATGVSAQGLSASLRDILVPSRTLARLSDARLRILGLRARTADDFKTGDATADAVEATVRLEDGPARSRNLAAMLDAADGVTTIESREANAASPMLSDAVVRVASEPKAGSSKIVFDARLHITGAQLRIDNIRGTLNGAPFTGIAGADLAGIPTFEWNLAFVRLAFINNVETEAPLDTLIDGTPAVRASALTDLDLAWLNRLQASGTTRVEDARIGPIWAGGVEVRTNVGDGALDIAVTAARFYDGTARARYVLSRATDGEHHQLSLSIQKARALSLLNDLIGVRGLDGATNIRLDARAIGHQSNDVVKTISGLVDLSVIEGSLNGLDLASTAGSSTGGRGKTAADALSTHFSRLSSTFLIQSGRAATDDLHFEAPMIETRGAGAIDLVAKTIDFTLHPSLAGRSHGRVDIPVHIAGPWGSPAVSTDFSGVLANPSATLQSLQDLGSALTKGGGLNNGGVGGLLDSILPRRAPGTLEAK